jgi:hypothetical protein
MMTAKCQICEQVRQLLWMLLAAGLVAGAGVKAGLDINLVLGLAVGAGLLVSFIRQRLKGKQTRRDE